MRLPLTPHGTREILLYGGLSLLLALIGGMLHPAAALPGAVLGCFVLAFFRDPERRPHGGAEVAVSPADGTVSDIGTVDEPHMIGGPALRIGIFLSVFDVHVNRAPLDGTITAVRYSAGRFHDARKQECIAENEANLAGFRGARGVFAVRQVAGLIARRIVFPFEPGRAFARGERMGMIKFGSRTEFFVPSGTAGTVEVEIGQKVKGGETVLFRYTA